jgi:hypothetical protein
MAKRRGGVGGDFPLDNNFDKLARVVDDLRQRLTAFGKAVDGAVARAGGASGAAAATAKNTGELRDLVKVRETLSAIKDVKEAIGAGTTLAKAMGLDEAARKLEAAEKGASLFEAAAKGATGAAKALAAALAAAGTAVSFTALRTQVVALGVAFKPILVAVGALAAGMVAAQRAIEVTTGVSLRFSDIFELVGLSLAKAFEEARLKILDLRITFEELRAIVTNTKPDLAALTSEFDATSASVDELQRRINDLDIKEAPKFEGVGAELTRVKNQFVELFGEIGNAADKVLGGLSTSTDRAAKSFEKLKEQVTAAARDLRSKLLSISLSNTNDPIVAAEIMGKQVALEREERLKTLAVMEQQLANLKAQGGSATDILEIEEKLRQIKTDETRLREEEGLSISRRAQELGQQSGQATGGVWVSGVEQALADAAPNINQQIVDMLTVDKNGEVISSFKDLLRNIARLFRENPIGFLGGFLGLSGGAGAGLGGLSGTKAGAGGTPLAFAHGGKIPAGGVASLGHYLSPIGRAFGGAVDAVGAALARPAGLHPSDTVPLWGAVGEFMHPVSSVRRYGENFMESVRRGDFPVEVARAFSGGIRAPAPVRSSLPRGYAAGGPIGPVTGGGVAGAPTVLPVLAADGPTLERLLRGGRNELLKVLHEEGVSFSR